MTQVLIAGCGDLGQGVAQYFVKKQAQVTGIRRSGTVFPDGVRGMTHDLLTLPAEQWPDADLLYLIMTPQGRTAEAYHRAYVMTAAAVVAAYQGRRQPKVIFVSSTSVYHQGDGGWVDEESPVKPQGFSGQRQLSALSQ